MVTVAVSGPAYWRRFHPTFDRLLWDLVPPLNATPHRSNAALLGSLLGGVLFPSSYRS